MWRGESNRTRHDRNVCIAGCDPDERNDDSLPLLVVEDVKRAARFDAGDYVPRSDQVLPTPAVNGKRCPC